MCNWMYYTGSECVHRPEQPHHSRSGIPVPVDEHKFMLHGMWRLVFCRRYWARDAASPGTAKPCAPPPKPDYYRMTRDMLDPGYELIAEGTYPDGTKDYRCPRCRGVEPQSGKKTKYPRLPDWNAGQ